MKIINNEEELVGKTITRAEFVDYHEQLVLVFDDGRYCIINIYDRDAGEIGMGIKEDLDIRGQLKGGIISEEEYQISIAIEEKESKVRRRVAYQMLKDEFSNESFEGEELV